jgi:hypothetical protein
MTTPVVTGYFVVKNSSNSGSDSTVTIPANSNFATISAVWWNNSDITSCAMTLDGQTCVELFFGWHGVGYTSNSHYYVSGFTPGTNKTFAWDWSGTSNHSEGVVYAITFYRDVDTASPIRDWDYAEQENDNTSTSTPSITSSVDDLGVVQCGAYSRAIVIDGVDGQTQIVQDSYNADYVAVATKSGATTLTGTATISYNNIVIISLKGASSTNPFTADTILPVPIVEASFTQTNPFTAETILPVPVSSAVFTNEAENLFTAETVLPVPVVEASFTQTNLFTADTILPVPIVEASFTNGTDIPSVGQSTVEVSHPDGPYTGYAVDDQHWTLAGSPYRINGNILVRKGSTLTIDAGVKVEFTGRYSLRLFGGIYAVGTAASHIVFTTTDADIALGGSWVGWRGIRITGADFDDTVIDHGTGIFNFQYCDIGYVDKLDGVQEHPWEEYDGAFYSHGCHYDDFIFDNNYIHHSRSIGIAYYGGQNSSAYLTSEPYFYSNIFEYMDGFGAISLDHAYASAGVHRPVHFAGGEVNHHTGTVNLFTVGYAWDAELHLDSLSVSDSGDRYTAPWFYTDGGGVIYYTALEENPFTAETTLPVPVAGASFTQENLFTAETTLPVPVVEASFTQENLFTAETTLPIPVVGASFTQENLFTAETILPVPVSSAVFTNEAENPFTAETTLPVPVVEASFTQENLFTAETTLPVPVVEASFVNGQINPFTAETTLPVPVVEASFTQSNPFTVETTLPVPVQGALFTQENPFTADTVLPVPVDPVPVPRAIFTISSEIRIVSGDEIDRIVPTIGVY